MKKTIAIINVLLLSFLFSVDTYTVIQDSSRLEWIGSKVTGSHDGVIDFKSGTVMIKDKKLQSAELVVDMKSITCLDIKKKSSNEYFVDHLKSDDFFGVKNFGRFVFLNDLATPWPAWQYGLITSVCRSN